MLLRPSQVETLRLARKLEKRYCCSFEAADLAWFLGIQTASAARRLKGLVSTGHMQVEPVEEHRRFYSLTQLGHEALEGR